MKGGYPIEVFAVKREPVGKLRSASRTSKSDLFHFLIRLPIIAFDAGPLVIHARLFAELAADGTAVGSHDLIIAATALTKGYIVTTRDERSFLKILGLSYQRW